jgi:hypothetical protein
VCESSHGLHVHFAVGFHDDVIRKVVLLLLTGTSRVGRIVIVVARVVADVSFDLLFYD